MYPGNQYYRDRKRKREGEREIKPRPNHWTLISDVRCSCAHCLVSSHALFEICGGTNIYDILQFYLTLIICITIQLSI